MKSKARLLLVIVVLQGVVFATATADEPEDTSSAHRPEFLDREVAGREKFYQEVLVTQQSRFGFQGMSMASGVRYGVLSSFTVEKASADGSLQAQQKVEATRLIEADANTKAVYQGLLQRLVGATYTMTLNPDMEITSLKGTNEVVRAAAGGNLLGWQSFMQASLIDVDGWRELNQLTFFRPSRPLKPGQKWDRELTHGWGPLGDWKGRVHYVCLDKQSVDHRIRYAMNLTHRPPAANDGLAPLEITNPTFKHGEAGGMIYFDAEQERISRVEERFHVRGTMSVVLLGQSTTVEIEERQAFDVRVLRQKPTGY